MENVFGRVRLSTRTELRKCCITLQENFIALTMKKEIELKKNRDVKLFKR